MGKPKTDSGEQKKPSSGSGSANSGASSKQNPGKLPPAGFIYSDDENLMDELSMGWGLTANDEEDELDAVINKTVDMSKVSNTKLKALAEPPKDGVERIERVRAERASKEMPQQQASPSVREQEEREAAAKRAKQAAAEREEAARAAAQREKAEREFAAREAAEREAALKKRAEEEAREKEAKERAAKETAARSKHDDKELAEREARERLAREQEEEEARERAALEARLLKRAEQEAREREEREAREREEREAKDREERAEEERIAAAARARAEKEEAERLEAEREIAERERLQKEAAAKLKARQEEARREAEEEAAREREEAEALAREESEARELEEQERQKTEKRERLEQEAQEKARAEKEKLEKNEKTDKSTTAPGKVGRIESSKKEIKAQRIGGPKTTEEKKPAVSAKEESAAQENGTTAEETKEGKKDAPHMEKTGTTSRLSRTPEEELAALLAEDEPELAAPSTAPAETAPKKVIVGPQDAKTSRSGLAAMEPTDDTPLTGVLKVIKPADRAKTPAVVAKEESSTADAIETATAESSIGSKPIDAESTESEATDVKVVDSAGGSEVSESEVSESEISEVSEVPELSEVSSVAETAEVMESPEVSEVSENIEISKIEEFASDSDDEGSADIANSAAADEEVGLASSAADVPDFLKTDIPPKTEEPKEEKLSGVDKFYKPERVKLGDFVNKKRAEGAQAKAEKAQGKPESIDKSEKKNSIEQAETAALQILKLPEPVVAKADAAEDAKSTKDEIRDAVKQESPEKKAAIIAALKKLEEQVDESNLDALSTDSLKDVLAKLPDLGTAPSATPGKKDGSRGRTPSPAVARLAPLEEPSPDREIAREKLKVMQKMAHTLPVVKSYLPQKRAMLIIAAVAILSTLAAVMTVRAETISARQALQKKDYNGALSSLGIALTLYPLSAEAHFLKGSALYLTEKYNDAYNEYDTALKLSPDMRDALERRAAVSYKLGNYAQSVADYEKLLQQEGEQSWRFDQLLSLANAYLKVGNLQKAADMYNRCLDRKPNYLPAMIGKIAVSNEKRLYERAIIEAGKALATSPANKEVLILRARAYIGMRDIANAQKDLDAVVKKNPKSGPVYAARAALRLAQKKSADAYAEFEKAIKFSPKDSSILLERAQAYINDRKLDLAGKDISKAKQLMGAQQTAQLYIVNSQFQIANRQAAKAVDDLKEAEAKFPHNSDVILALADALAASGKVGEGIVTTEKAMEMDKSDVDAIVKHGLLSVKFGNKMRAAEDFGEALKLDPKNVIAYKSRGMLYLQQEKFASAQEDLSKVVALDPSQSDAKVALDKARVAFAKITRVRSTGVQREGPSDAYLASLASKPFDTLINDGYSAYKRGDYLTAVPTLEQAVKMNPKDVRARRYLAYAYKQGDQLGEAAGQFDALYPLGALGPQDTVIYIDMLMGSGQQDKAIKIIEDAIAKNPTSQILYLHLANCQVTRGESANAVATCTRGIAINARSEVGQQLVELRRSILNGGSGSDGGNNGNGGGEQAPPGA